jgi:Imelysin.
MFDIGKAEELQYKFYMNVYPLTVADVDANITTGVYDLNSVNNQDAQGFPALDYLLYGIGATDSDILEKYTTVENSDNYKAYLKAVVNQMQTLTTTVVSDFKLQKSIFVNNTQNTATSAFNKLINDFIFYYEKGLRANKFGIPAGVFSTTPLPEKVEGLFNKDSSKELALEALTAVTNFFEGASFTTGAKATSFNAYLQALDRSDIATSISNQLEKAIAQVTTLNDNFYTQITTDNTAMTKSYDELQKVVILLKVDMLQAFNISVDYVDADGD